MQNLDNMLYEGEMCSGIALLGEMALTLCRPTVILRVNSLDSPTGRNVPPLAPARLLQL